MNIEQKKIIKQIANWSKLYVITLIVSILMTLYWVGGIVYNVFNDFSFYEMNDVFYIIDDFVHTIIDVLLIIVLFKIFREFTPNKSSQYNFWEMGFDAIRKIFLLMMLIGIFSFLTSFFRKIIEL